MDNFNKFESLRRVQEERLEALPQGLMDYINERADDWVSHPRKTSDEVTPSCPENFIGQGILNDALMFIYMDNEYSHMQKLLEMLIANAEGVSQNSPNLPKLREWKKMIDEKVSQG
jgi:hypothetical protein